MAPPPEGATKRPAVQRGRLSEAVYGPQHGTRRRAALALAPAGRTASPAAPKTCARRAVPGAQRPRGATARRVTGPGRQRRLPGGCIHRSCLRGRVWPLGGPRPYPAVPANGRAGAGAPGAAQGDGDDERTAGRDRLRQPARPARTLAVAGFREQASRAGHEDGRFAGRGSWTNQDKRTQVRRGGAAKAGPHGDRGRSRERSSEVPRGSRRRAGFGG